MSTVKNWSMDAQVTVVDGMNGGRQPELLAESEAALLRNVSIRGGRAHTRPNIVKRMTLPAGLLQGSTVFNAISRLIVSIDGKVYEINPATWERIEKTAWIDSDEISLSSDEKDLLRAQRRNNPTRPRHFYGETVGSLIIQDFQAAPIIYDGVSIRRAEDDEVPVGGAMAYSNGRLAVVVNRGFDVRLGNIRQDTHQSELKFTETYELDGGGDFSFPDEVKSLSVLPVIDTGSGHGPLIVGCKNQVFTLKTHITQRALWPDIAMQTVLLPTRGVVGAGAVAAVNQDLFFRSSDGLRSLRTSTADYDAPGLAPISAEVRKRFDYDTPFLLEDAQVAYFDNRLICTHSPFVYSNRSLAQGLISLNFDAISARGQKGAPAYDGEWDGVIVSSIATGDINGSNRCFIVGRDSDGTNALWELLAEREDPAGEEITQVYESRMLFAQNSVIRKLLRRLDFNVSGLRGSADITAYFRPDKYPYWVQWDEWTVNVPASPAPWGSGQHQSYVALSTRSTPEHIDQITGTPVNLGFGFQVRIEVTGNCQIDDVKVFQEPVPPSAYAQVPKNPEDLVSGVPAWAVNPSFWYSHPVSPLAGLT